MENNKNTFENNEIKVTFDPQICIHSDICAKGLSDVFRTTVLPWINLEESTSKKIISQIKKCPSGALDYRFKRIKVPVS